MEMGKRQRTVESEQFTTSFKYILNSSHNLSPTVALTTKSKLKEGLTAKRCNSSRKASVEEDDQEKKKTFILE